MDDVKMKNVFVSHYHEDEESIRKLKELLGDTCQLRNYSVTSEKFNNAQNDEYIKSLLRPLIKAAGTFICLIGEKTKDSDWVDWEIRQAAKQGKRIIGVFCNGSRDADIPEALKELADAMVGWRKDKIEAAIDGDSTFENADGTTRTMTTNSRGTC